MNSKIQKFAPLISSVITLVVYMLTMSKGVMPIDAGELAASQYTLGISHPSGYPLFNILGFLWSKLPIGSVIFRLNLLCAIWVALANFFLVKTAFIILKNSLFTKTEVKKGSQKKGLVEIATTNVSFLPCMLASVSGILILAFCKTWWIQSAGVEVYSLHVALLSAFFFVFIRTVFTPEASRKDWVICGILLGLCLTNHLTSILIIPGVIVIYFWKMNFKKEAFISGTILAASAFVVFLCLYGFMMLRAGSDPVVNYGNPDNPEYLNRHVQGWQFQAFMDTKDKKGNSSVANFFQFFIEQTAVIGALLALAGFVFSCTRNAKMAVFCLMNLLATLIYISMYDIHDIENYFLLGYISLGIFMTFGIYGLLIRLKNIEKSKAIYLILLIPVLPIVFNYSHADQSKLSYIDDYSRAAINSVEDNAIIISREWDVFVSPAYYYHLVERQRPDVTILDKELLRRSWYHNQIEAWDKDLAGKIKKQAEEFNEAVRPFERKQKFNPAIIQQKFENYITSILNEYKNRPVYVSSLVLDADIARGVDVKLPPGTILIPDAYFFRIVPNDTSVYYPLSKPLEYNVHFTENAKDEKFQRMILNFSMNVLSSRVGYEMGYGKKEEARKIVLILQTIDPKITMPEGL
jgi:hypothetical protein